MIDEFLQKLYMDPTKIPEKCFVKRPQILNLYHASMENGIKELTPRVPTAVEKYENTTIPRISASLGVMGCVKAIQHKLFTKDRYTLYVYKLDLTSSSVVVKPNTLMVKDRNETNEFWVLTPTKVHHVATYQCTYDGKTANLVPVYINDK